MQEISRIFQINFIWKYLWLACTMQNDIFWCKVKSRISLNPCRNSNGNLTAETINQHTESIWKASINIIHLLQTHLLGRWKKWKVFPFAAHAWSAVPPATLSLPKYRWEVLWNPQNLPTWGFPSVLKVNARSPGVPPHYPAIDWLFLHKEPDHVLQTVMKKVTK